MRLQLRPALGREALPVVALRDQQGPVVGRLGELVGELQEKQVGELLQVVAVAHAVVAQGVTEAPDLGDSVFVLVLDDQPQFLQLRKVPPERRRGEAGIPPSRNG